MIPKSDALSNQAAAQSPKQPWSDADRNGTPAPAFRRMTMANLHTRKGEHRVFPIRTDEEKLAERLDMVAGFVEEYPWYVRMSDYGVQRLARRIKAAGHTAISVPTIEVGYRIVLLKTNALCPSTAQRSLTWDYVREMSNKPKGRKRLICGINRPLLTSRTKAQVRRVFPTNVPISAIREVGLKYGIAWIQDGRNSWKTDGGCTKAMLRLIIAEAETLVKTG